MSLFIDSRMTGSITLFCFSFEELRFSVISVLGRNDEAHLSQLLGQL